MAVLGLDIAHIGVSLNRAILFPSMHFRNIQAPIEGTYLAADTAGMVKPLPVGFIIPARPIPRVKAAVRSRPGS
jgi:hypothetical protein